MLPKYWEILELSNRRADHHVCDPRDTMTAAAPKVGRSAAYPGKGVFSL
jgi:hypothetical protein